MGGNQATTLLVDGVRRTTQDAASGSQQRQGTTIAGNFKFSHRHTALASGSIVTSARQ
jgi:hypothetical protein